MPDGCPEFDPDVVGSLDMVDSLDEDIRLNMPADGCGACPGERIVSVTYLCKTCFIIFTYIGSKLQNSEGLTGA